MRIKENKQKRKKKNLHLEDTKMPIVTLCQ